MHLNNEIEVARKWYGNRKSQTGWLIIDHAVDTAKYLEKALITSKESDPYNTRRLVLACLGHDLFEDTEVSKSIVSAKWGEEVVNLIGGLTNLKGDGDFDDYINNLSVADESILLVKFADINSNLANSIENIKTIKKEWLTNFWLPLLNRYDSELLSRNFQTYPKTANYFVNNIRLGIQKISLYLAN